MQQPEREGDTLPRAKVKNECRYTSAPPIYPRGPYSDNFSFCPSDISAVPHLHEILSALPSGIKKTGVTEINTPDNRKHVVRRVLFS